MISAMGIDIKCVSKTYPAKSDGDGVIRALDQVDLTIEKGEWVSIMGPSGSGKSTLVNLIGCLDQPSSGEVWIEKQNVVELDRRQLDRFRAEKIGFIFQQFHLIPYLTALENVMLAQYFHSMTDEAEALEALRRVGLKDRAHHIPAHLSGGEQQRVCIARALINDPAIVLADEPTGNLDAQNEEIVLRLLREFHEQGRTIVMVTHDPTVARLADRRIELHHGKISAQEIFSFSDEEEFDEILEEIWVLKENGEVADMGRIQVDGALPVDLAIEKMADLNLLTLADHQSSEPHTHKEILNRCHEAMQVSGPVPEHGRFTVDFTERGRQRAGEIIRRHRLAERLFTETLHIESEAEIEQQACKFEHILSAQATERICTFLEHPRTCPHGSPIPEGECCVKAKRAGNGSS
jgi:putative ABC transport system ATP-binding protein